MSDREITVDRVQYLFERRVSLTQQDDGILTLEVSTPLVTTGLVSVYLLGFVAMIAGPALPAVVRVPLVVASLTFVPGGIVVLLVDADQLIGARQVLYAYGTSLLLLMFVGAATNIYLPVFGFDSPLTPLPLAGGVTVAVCALGAVTVYRSRRGSVRVRTPELFEPAPLGLLALPLVTAVGVTILNVAGSNLVLLVALALVAVVPLVALEWIRREWYAFGVWTMALAILYHKSLWRFSGFGGRPHGINAWKVGRWSPGITELNPYTSELLPTGLLFPMYAHLTDVFILTEYEMINPFLVSFIPVAVFVAVRSFADADVSLLAAALFAFAHPFYLQYPTAGRAASPVIFLALFGLALTDTEYRSTVRSIFAVAFLAGIVASHYGTSYLVMFALTLAMAVLLVLRQLDRLVDGRFAAFTDEASLDERNALESAGRRGALLTPLLVLYFCITTLAWYMYMRGGWKFQMLVKHIDDNLDQASSLELGGRTAARVTKDYGTPSIRLAKYIYILVGVFMAIGLVVALYRRLIVRDGAVEDQYFALAGGMFTIFGLTFIFRNWGGGRPMMITFTFTTAFAVIGVVWLADRVPVLDGRKGFAVLLATLFVLNSGVAAATVLGGIAATNVPLHPTLANSDTPEGQYIVHRDTDAAAHIWTVNHGDQQVYADTFGARQYDWFRPRLAATTPVDVEYGPNRPSVFDPTRRVPDAGYIMILGHNQELDTFWPVHPRFEPGVPLETLRLPDRHRVYTNGESAVYSIPTAGNTTNGTAGVDETENER